MPSKKTSALTSPTTRSLALLILITIGAGLSISCSNKDNQPPRGNTVQQPTASPTPSPSPAPSLQPEGDTIIVIKGGSVELIFSEAIYAPTSGTNPNYVCATCAFKTLEVGPVDGPFTPCPIANQNSTITIHAGGGQKNIKIKRNPQSKIQIEFNASEYGAGPAGQQHYNPNNNIQKVQVTPSLNCQCPRGQKCEIHVTTSY